MNLFAQSNW